VKRRHLTPADFIPPVLTRGASLLLGRALPRQPRARDKEGPPPIVVADGENPEFLNAFTGNPVFSLSLAKVRYSDGRLYNREKHHFVRYYHEGLTSLSEFYKRHQPTNIFEAHFLPAARPGLPEADRVPWFDPRWEARGKGECGLPDSDGLQQYGPVSDKKVRLEADRLDGVLDSIRVNGFMPESYGYPAGYFLLRTNGDWVFVIRGGFHRVAALAYLEYDRVQAQFFSGYPRFVYEAACSDWPLVREGKLTSDEARDICRQFFLS
jgi:hypothetical protein